MPLDLVDALIDVPNTLAIKWSAPTIEVFMAGVRRFLPRVAVVNNTFHTVMGHLLGCRVFVSHWPNFYPEFPWRVPPVMCPGFYPGAPRPLDPLTAPPAPP